MRNKRVILALTGLAVSYAIGAALPVHAEGVLRAEAALPTTIIYTKSFLKNFVERVNKETAGDLRINYVGGREVRPPRRASAALKRGVVDILYSPSGYYAGAVPEAHALMVATKLPPEIRGRGGYDLLNDIWGQKLNARILGWGEAAGQYNLYFVKKPSISSSGLDLSGLKIRSTGVFRYMIEALGGTPVSIQTAEIYTAVERGVVDGIGFPEVGLTNLGLQRLIKYRIDPPFYRFTTLILINLDKWKSLSNRDRELLQRIGMEYESTSIADIKAASARETKLMKDASLKIVELEGAARNHYLATAQRAIWDRLAKTVRPEIRKAAEGKALRVTAGTGDRTDGYSKFRRRVSLTFVSSGPRKYICRSRKANLLGSTFLRKSQNHRAYAGQIAASLVLVRRFFPARYVEHCHRLLFSRL